MTTSFLKQVFHLKILRGIRSIIEKLEGQAEDLSEVMQGNGRRNVLWRHKPFDEQVNLGISTTNNTRAEGDLVMHLAKFGGRGLMPCDIKQENMMKQTSRMGNIILDVVIFKLRYQTRKSTNDQRDALKFERHLGDSKTKPLR